MKPDATQTRQQLEQTIAEGGGILRLDPAFVARDWLPPGRRLGSAEHKYDLGERGSICERWLASTTHADNVRGPEDEGISYIRTAGGGRINLADAVEAAPDLLMGKEYATTHQGLDRLAKIFDFGARIPYHIHPPAEQAALVGKELPLLGRLHALGHHVAVARAGQGHDRRDHRGRLALAGDAVQQLAVDLDHLHRELAQAPQ